MDKKSNNSMNNFDKDYYLYLKYKSKYLKLKNQNCSACVQLGGNNSKIELILFKADWCGHCKRFVPTWEKMQKKYKNKYNFITIDSNEKEQLKNWNVKGFPTIYVKNNNTAVEYGGLREEEDIIKFIKEVEQIDN
jgi:thiol-disulfide isomerase/thioredoxin